MSLRPTRRHGRYWETARKQEQLCVRLLITTRYSIPQAFKLSSVPGDSFDSFHSLSAPAICGRRNRTSLYLVCTRKVAIHRRREHSSRPRSVSSKAAVYSPTHYEYMSRARTQGRLKSTHRYQQYFASVRYTRMYCVPLTGNFSCPGRPR